MNREFAKTFWSSKLEKLALLFVTPEMIKQQPYGAFKNLLLAGLMFVIALISLVFGVFHFFLTKETTSITMNLIGSFYIFILIYSVYKTKSIKWQSHALVLLAFLYFPIFLYLNEAKDYSLAWLFVVPFSIIAILGNVAGLRYLFVFYMIIFTMAYQAIGVWDNGAWNEVSFSRLVVGSLLAVALAMVIEMAQSGLNKSLQAEKAKEKGYIEELKRLATIDSLTGLYNRRYLNEVIDERIKTLSRTDAYLMFFIVDIDHFKLYNDTFGHLAGDEVLIKIAQNVKKYIKRYDDLVFRLGGEEFGGVITTKKPEETAKWLAGLVPEIEALDIKHSSLCHFPRVTISVGIRYCKASKIPDISHLYRTADEALYQAKEQGRNRAVVWRKENSQEMHS